MTDEQFEELISVLKFKNKILDKMENDLYAISVLLNETPEDNHPRTEAIREISEGLQNLLDYVENIKRGGE